MTLDCQFGSISDFFAGARPTKSFSRRAAGVMSAMDIFFTLSARN